MISFLEKNNYYPFGLKHSGYTATTIGNKNYQYKYQGQELQDELGLGWYSFKYRNYDPAIGRFFNIDPLADRFSYQSPYNFQENKMGSGVELEGLELQLAPYLLESLAAAGTGGVILGTAHTQNAGAQVPDILTINLSETIIVGTVSTATGINNEFNQNSGKSIFGKIISGIASGLNATWNILNNDSDNSKKENKRKGKEAERKVTEELQQEFPEDVVLTQVTGKFEDGSRTVFDDVVVDSKTGKAKQTNETKTGNAKQTTQQKRYRKGESVELRGNNAGSEKGQKINVKNTPDRETRKP